MHLQLNLFWVEHMFTKVNQCGFKLVSRLEHVHGILEQVKNISKNACKASGAFCPFPIAFLLLPLRPLNTLPQKFHIAN